MKLKNMKPVEPWKPAKSGDIEHSKSLYFKLLSFHSPFTSIAHLMDMTSKKRKRGGDDDEEDDDDNDKKK